jgi:hypothetical protein
MAVGVGFEPTEGINPQRFSRPPLSTTQPAHRKLLSRRFYTIRKRAGLYNDENRTQEGEGSCVRV